MRTNQDTQCTQRPAADLSLVRLFLDLDSDETNGVVLQRDRNRHVLQLPSGRRGQHRQLSPECQRHVGEGRTPFGLQPGRRPTRARTSVPRSPRRDDLLVTPVDGGRLAVMRSGPPGGSGRPSRSPRASRPSTRGSSASAARADPVPMSPSVPESGEVTGASTPARRAHERTLRTPAFPLMPRHPAKRIRAGDASSSSPYQSPLNALKHLSSILEACAAQPETSVLS